MPRIRVTAARRIMLALCVRSPREYARFTRCGFQARPALKQNGVLFPWLAVSVHAAQRGKRLLLSPLCRERRVNSAGQGVERSGFIKHRGDLRGPERLPVVSLGTRGKPRTRFPLCPRFKLPVSVPPLRASRPSSATSAAIHSFPRKLSLRLRSRLVPAPKTSFALHKIRRASHRPQSRQERKSYAHFVSEAVEGGASEIKVFFGRRMSEISG